MGKAGKGLNSVHVNTAAWGFHDSVVLGWWDVVVFCG